jgi:hypothetical protein
MHLLIHGTAIAMLMEIPSETIFFLDRIPLFRDSCESFKSKYLWPVQDVLLSSYSITYVLQAVGKSFD